MNEPAINLDTETIASLQDRMAAGGLSARELTEHCLARIEAHDLSVDRPNESRELTGNGGGDNCRLDLSRKSAGYLSPLRSYPFKRERAFTA